MSKANKKTMLIGIALIVTLMLSASAAFAATGSYSGTVYKTSDLYSPSALTKTGTGQACFNVTTYQGSGYCDFWLEFDNGANITSKKTVGTTVGKTTLSFGPTPSHYKGTSMYLCVSTSITTLQSQYVKGRWSPDNVTL